MSGARGIAVAAVFVASLLAVAVGCGLVYLPAGLVVGGVIGAACTGLYARGAIRDQQRDHPLP